MKILHYDIYQAQAVGMSNVVMSVENALIIAFLTKRDKIVFYGNNNLFLSNSKKLGCHNFAKRFRICYNV